MTSQQIRQQFIDFFVQKHGHTFVPSSPVVPHDDPTLLFTNAGMNQFKPIFLGQEKRAYTRAVNTQKCIRAGGKHNDLDDVGRSRRHHTFFEMLGNWSFGDYFKRGAIEMAWELLTKVWTLDPRRIHVSCYEGDEKAGIPRDSEAANLWKEVAGLPDDHIHFFGKDNFWEMGDTGPCGPCTEIYYDRTPNADGGSQVNGDDPRVMEIWNLVFIQYNRDANGKLTTLSAQHVDTGMGLGRICQLLQGKDDNYAIDMWEPLLAAISRLSGITYTGLFPKSNTADPQAEAANPQLRHDIASRVVADHACCLTIALTDGAVPSNEGRGYVLRRILRRAVRFGRQQLGLHEPFMHTLVPVVVEMLGDAFPELKKNPQHVAEIIKDEEVSFGKTLDRGIQLFDEACGQSVGEEYAQLRGWIFAGCARKSEVGGPWPPNGGQELKATMQIMLEDRAGKEYDVDLFAAIRELTTAGRTVKVASSDAFKLHDTYGFPIDLTRIMAEERGMAVDIAGYEKLMEQAKELARAGGKEAETSVANLPPDAIAQLQGEKIPPTNDQPKFSHVAINATVQAIWDGEKFVEQAEGSGEFAVILNHTNFYAEMGGQVGDSGFLGWESQNPFTVRTTRNIGGYILHVGKLTSGKISVGQTVTAEISDRRYGIENNHTSTHLLNWALRQVLGDGVQQKGSLVDPEKLRFDFSHPKALSEPELNAVEQLAVAKIEKPVPVYAQEVPQEQALKINGLRAVFGEKYPPLVRVVSTGVPVSDLLADPTNPQWREYPIEFCGGTHLQNTADAGTLTITSEESVSKGIRRIVALTGDAARQALANAQKLDGIIEKSKTTADADLSDVIAEINAHLANLVIPLRAERRAQAAVAELQSRAKAFEKAAKSQPASGVDAVSAAASLLAGATDLGGGKLVVGEIAGASDDQLRSAIDSLKKKSGSYAIMLVSAGDAKVTFVAAVSDDLIAKGLKAGDWIKETAKAAGGGGGGRPQMAQGSGKDVAKLADALAAAKAVARRIK